MVSDEKSELREDAAEDGRAMIGPSSSSDAADEAALASVAGFDAAVDMHRMDLCGGANVLLPNRD